MQVLANKIPGPNAIEYLLIFEFIQVKKPKDNQNPNSSNSRQKGSKI
jgi:hypothetical protein